MNDQLFIPTKIKVGYQERHDTYTKKLGYVIYYDAKGKLRKEGSWESWRDKKINFDEFDNTPTEGFVLNRDVGGTRHSYSWNARLEKVRVYDPRGFEFEITIPNLLFILQECTSIKGKGLDGQFVYSWSGTELVLIPVTCEEYKKSTGFTSLQAGKVGVKDLVPGCAYQTKKQQNLIYLGKFDWYTFEYFKDSSGQSKYNQKKSIHRKLFVFVNDSKTLVPLTGLTGLAAKVTDVAVDNYADLVDIYSKSQFASSVVGIEDVPTVIKFTEQDHYYKSVYKKEGNGYKRVQIYQDKRYDHDTKSYKVGHYQMYDDQRVTFDSTDNTLLQKHLDRNYSQQQQKYTLEEVNQQGFVQLKAVFSNGNKIKLDKL